MIIGTLKNCPECRKIECKCLKTFGTPMTPYNKEEAMKEIFQSEPMQRLMNAEATLMATGRLGNYDGKQTTTEVLSSALDSAYKAGREEMYLAGGKACKKAYQNHKEDHLCRFNDGEQNCNCYLSGINEVIVTLEALI